MEKEELFELIDIETPEDFQYFEQFADLVECDQDVEYDDFYAALSKVDSETLAEINENYFTELEKAFPDDCDDFLEVVTNMVKNLKNLVFDTADDIYRREYVNQLFTFHEMYTKKDGASVDGVPCSPMEAIADSKAAKLDNIKHVYDFENSLDYEPEYISIRLGGYTENE